MYTYHFALLGTLFTLMVAHGTEYNLWSSPQKSKNPTQRMLDDYRQSQGMHPSKRLSLTGQRGFTSTNASRSPAGLSSSQPYHYFESNQRAEVGITF